MKIKRFLVWLPIVVILLFIAGIVFYQTFICHDVSGNNQADANSKLIYVITSDVIDSQFSDKIDKDFIISNQKKYNTDSELCSKIKQNMKSKLKEYIEKNDEKHAPDLDKCAYYIEIRNKQVYNVIYSKWSLSTYVGSYPNYHYYLACDFYCSMASEAYNEFKNRDKSD